MTDSEASPTIDDQNTLIEKDGLADKIIADSRPLGSTGESGEVGGYLNGGWM